MLSGFRSLWIKPEALIAEYPSKILEKSEKISSDDSFPECSSIYLCFLCSFEEYHWDSTPEG